MDELILSGKKYISSKRASEVTGYAKDYVGQLIRGGKIPATRVGRAWYVDEEALKSYEITGTAIAISEEKVPNTPVLEVIERSPEVQELLKLPRAKTLPSVQHLSLKAVRALPKTWGGVSYLPESDSELIVLSRSKLDKALSPVHVRKSHISDRRDYKNIRIRILKDTLTREGFKNASFDIPKKPEVKKEAQAIYARALSVAEESRKAPQLKRTLVVSKPQRVVLKGRSRFEPYALVAASFVAFVLLSSGFFVGSHIVVAPSSGANSANAYFSYQYIHDTVSTQPFVQEGVSTLQGFFSFLAKSPETLVKSAVEFIVKIPNLVSPR